MRLEIGNVKIEQVAFSERTFVKDRTLYINPDELCTHLKQDPNIQDVAIELAQPGESVRIIPIIDVVEPRVKVGGSAGVFPGILADMQAVGEGVTHALDGCTVMTMATDLLHFTQGIVDMSGPGAAYSCFSKLNNVVIIVTPRHDINAFNYEKSVRLAGLKAAAYLGKAAADIAPDEREIFTYDPILEAVQKYPDLPRIAYVYMLITQRRIEHTVYGLDAAGMLPTLISPTDVLDGAIVSGLTPAAGHRNTTYHHLRNPVIHELLRRHGKELCFLGVILTNEVLTLEGKERSSVFVTRIAKLIGAQGAIITEDGAGNPDTDLMLNCQNLEEAGIKTVLVTDEICGRDGASQGLADVTDRADAMISTGNFNELLTLPPMQRVIGSLDAVEKIAGGFHGSLHEDGSITVETASLLGALCELGFERITTRLR
jgi:glycine reductase